MVGCSQGCRRADASLEQNGFLCRSPGRGWCVHVVQVYLVGLRIQAVCDIATSSSRETVFGTCVEFVERTSALTNASSSIAKNPLLCTNSHGAALTRVATYRVRARQEESVPLWYTNSYCTTLTEAATYRSVVKLEDVPFLQSDLLSP